MDDQVKIVEAMSGASGGLATMANTCHKLNGTLSKVSDSTFGSEGTDTFDASCNTCKSFSRLPFDKKDRNPSLYGFPGTCTKFNKPTTGYKRGIYCGFENDPCYENRVTGMTPTEHCDIWKAKFAEDKT